MPLLEMEGIRREIDGRELLFCSHACLGAYYQQDSIVTF